MTPSGDHLDEMNTTDPVLGDFLDELSTLVDVAAPPPSDELEALFTSSLPLAKRGRPEAHHAPVARRLLTPLAVAAAVVAMLVGGAASHHLPAPAQRLISNVVNTVTPFHIDPDEHPAPAPRSDRPRPGSHAGGTTRPRPAPSNRSKAPGAPVAGSPVPGSPVRNSPVRNSPVRNSPVPGAPLSTGPGRSAASSAPSGAPNGKTLGHGKTHHPAPGAAHGVAHGRSTAPGQAGRSGVHGGGRPAPSSPVPSVRVSAPGAHGHDNGNGNGQPGSGRWSRAVGRLGQYTKSVRKALPKQRSGSLSAASARKSSSRG